MTPFVRFSVQASRGYHDDRDWHITMVGTSQVSVQVPWAAAPGSAVAGGDYVALTGSGALTWAPGETGLKNASMTIVGDLIGEATETFAITIALGTIVTTAQNVAVTVPSAAVTIIDNDPAVVSVADVTVTEGTDLTATITFTLSGVSSSTTSISYTTASGSAVAGSDFTTTSGTITWAPFANAPQTVTIPILNDNVYKLTETFLVNLAITAGTVSLSTRNHHRRRRPDLGGGLRDRG
jgi:hypothetical protein